MLPSVSDLPPSLRPLVRRQAFRPSRDFRSDVSPLAGDLEKVLGLDVAEYGFPELPATSANLPSPFLSRFKRLWEKA
jgi:hypothetical protein